MKYLNPSQALFKPRGESGDLSLCVQLELLGSFAAISGED